MNVDLFINLAAHVIKIVLADAGRNEGNLHTWTSTGRDWEWAPDVTLDGCDLYLSVTIYDRILNVAATRYRDGTACATRNREALWLVPA